MKQIIRNKFTVLLLLSIALFSCKSEKIEPVTQLPENISFQNDLIPLFNQSCNTTGCHNTGGIPPDLSAGNAYTSITGSNMIDLNNPENSKLYIRMIDTQSPMPLTGVMPYESRQVLSWIIDGAQNN